MVHPIWFGFFAALIIVMVVARWNLWLAMCIGALTLGLVSPGIGKVPGVFLDTVTDWSTVLLALAVGIIPLIGGVMERGGLMDDLVENLRIKRKAFLAASPALLGLLPMPGGALLSAPLVDKGGRGVPADRKSAINVWYRHLLILVYPLGSLLITTKMAGLDLYKAVLYTIPGFLLLLVLGQVFLIRQVEGEIRHKERFDGLKLTRPIFIVVMAPILHVCFKKIMGSWTPISDFVSELSLVIAVLASLAAALYFSSLPLKDIFPVTKKMRPWRFFLIIIGMFFFLNVFTASEAPKVISGLKVPDPVLLVGVGAFLGFATGRISAPVFILYPVYVGRVAAGVSGNAGPAIVGRSMMIPFILMYFSVFLGYVISPIHPCLIVTQEYFGITYKDMIKRLFLPTVVGLGVAFGAAVLLL